MIMTGGRSDIIRLWSGTSGLVLPVANKQALPPEWRDRPRISYYASLFNSIEVNSSFYKIPLPATFARWATEVPEDFQFTIKLWRGLTHVPDLRFNGEDVRRFMHAANNLAVKKGCLLIQLPPRLTVKASGQLADLLELTRQADSGQPWKLAVEFRNRSWYSPEVDKILSQHEAGRVLHDMPSSAITELPPNQPAISFVYLRFHGPKGDYKGGYEQPLLAAWAERIALWQSEKKEIYVYFNNTIGDALADLATLQALLPVV